MSDQCDSNMIQIQGIQITSEEAKNIISCDLLNHKGCLIRVNFYPPLADLIFLFKDEESRDKMFSNAQQEAK